jgi:hypothetical protein
VAVTACFLLQATSGCVSQEYRIADSELRRLTQLPPEQRGQRVRVVQDLGDRRSEPVRPESPPWPAEEAETHHHQGSNGGDIHVNVDAHVRVPSGGGSARSVAPPARGGSAGGTQVAPAVRGSFGGIRGGGSAGGAAPPLRGSAGGGVRAPSGGGGGGFKLGGGGGGGGGKGGEALVILAVVVVVVASVAAVCLVASEGTRFDGDAEIAPGQPVHIEHQDGSKHSVALGDLSEDDLRSVRKVSVNDDEGYGLRRLERAPLNRKGFAFKLDGGSSSFNHGPVQAVGPAAQIQLGLFATRKFGLLVDVGVSGSSSVPEGAAAPLDTPITLTRHSLALEAQYFPIALGRFHPGVFAKAGGALLGSPVGVERGRLLGGGALAELELTTRLALTLRAGLNAAELDSGWSTAGTITGGVAIY